MAGKKQYGPMQLRLAEVYIRLILIGSKFRLVEFYLPALFLFCEHTLKYFRISLFWWWWSSLSTTFVNAHASSFFIDVSLSLSFSNSGASIRHGEVGRLKSKRIQWMGSRGYMNLFSLSVNQAWVLLILKECIILRIIWSLNGIDKWNSISNRSCYKGSRIRD